MATLEVRVKEFITQAATDWKGIWAKLGAGNLNTTAQNIIAAINEVKATADAAASSTPVDATTSTKGISRRATDSQAVAQSASDLTLSPSNIAALRGAVNGLAALDGGGKVPAAQLPAYVDDVLEYANLAAFPATGTGGLIYVAVDTNRQYRWSGSAYVQLVASPGSTDAVPEGTTNLYFTDARADGRANTRITALVGNTDVDLAAYYTAAKA